MEVRVTIPGMPEGFFECSEPAIVTNWGNCVKGTGDPFCPKDGQVLETNDGIGGSEPMLDRSVTVHRDGSDLVVCEHPSMDGHEKYTLSELQILGDILKRTVKLSLGV